MADNIKKIVTDFHKLLLNDSNHRYKSWEHCYLYFSRTDISLDNDIACLHLSFYLASWGMYRGSSFLLWKDYKIHTEVVREILKNRELQIINFDNSGIEVYEKIVSLADWIRNRYRSSINCVNGDSKTINVTDTLVTKILLGTLGCIPAYDRYFIGGLKKAGISQVKLNVDSIEKIVRFYRDNREEFDSVQRDIYQISSIQYPIMKIVDMYFWEIGYQVDKSSKKEKQG